MSRGSSPISTTSGRPDRSTRSGATEIDWFPLPADGSPALWGVSAAGDRVCLVIAGESPLLIRTGDHTELVAQPGEALVLVGHERFVAATPRGCRALVVTALRAPIEALVGTPCRTERLRESALLGATTRFLHDLRELDAGHGGMPGATFERLVREMIVAVLIEARETVPGSPAWLGLLDRALEHIAGHCTDQNLGTPTLAHALNVSVRHLQRAFAATGSTPQREIRRHRAALAATLLGDRAFDCLTVDQVSHHCGFRTAADMRRALACHDIPSPRTLRAVRVPPVRASVPRVQPPHPLEPAFGEQMRRS